MQNVHSGLYRPEFENGKILARSQTAVVLDHQLVRFEGILARTQALLTRMNNQTSLVSLLLQVNKQS